MYRTLLFVAVFAAALAFGAQSAMAASIVVDDDGHATPANCNAASLAYPTIQDAVDFAEPDTTIKVCPGVYNEQVTVTTNKIRLVGVGNQAAQISPPETMTAPYALVLFTGGAVGDSIKNFSVKGPFPDELFCGTDAWGVKVEGGATATIQANHISEIRATSPALYGCQQGLGIGVGRMATSQVGHATITGNTIDTFQKGGIYVDGPGSKATIKNNTVTGTGPSDIIAANGIQISRNAIGKLSGNTVTANSYTGDSASSSGILLYQANGATRVSGDSASANDVNIWLSDTVGTQISLANVADGQWGIVADADVLNARILDSVASGNSVADCEDDSNGSGTAGTANTWKRNTGTISSPDGICTAPAESRFGRSARVIAPHASPAL
jgi:hypothetical protein